MKGEDKKNQKGLVTTLLELILINQILMNMKNLVEYKSTSKNQLKNHSLMIFQKDFQNQSLSQITQ